ncbi:MAG TPA: hypothetical protein VIK39_16665 [Candidatus Angelobacter sp.]
MSIIDDFLTSYFDDCQTEMRWRREVEYKLIGSFFPLYPALVAGLFALSAILTAHVVMFAAILLAGFVWIFFYYVRRKVKAEHTIYESIGEIVVKIWDRFGLFTSDAVKIGGVDTSREAMLKPASKNYGKGDGYRLTLNFFLLVSLATTVMLLSIGVIGEVAMLRPAEKWTASEASRQAIQASRDADPQTKDWLVRSLEWRSDQKQFSVVVIRTGRHDGYSILVNPATKTVVSLQTADSN